jgi:hypothetical protein
MSVGELDQFGPAARKVQPAQIESGYEIEPIDDPTVFSF